MASGGPEFQARTCAYLAAGSFNDASRLAKREGRLATRTRALSFTCEVSAVFPQPTRARVDCMSQPQQRQKPSFASQLAMFLQWELHQLDPPFAQQGISLRRQDRAAAAISRHTTRSDCRRCKELVRVIGRAIEKVQHRAPVGRGVGILLDGSVGCPRAEASRRQCTSPSFMHTICAIAVGTAKHVRFFVSTSAPASSSQNVTSACRKLSGVCSSHLT